MSQQSSRANRIWAALAVVAVPVLIFHSCSLLATGGEGHSGRRPWEFTVVAGFIVAACFTIVFYASAFSKGTTIAILEDRLVHQRWKQPILFTDIKAVTWVSTEFWGKRSMDIQLQFHDGATQLLPRLLLSTGPVRFANDLRAALAKHQAGAPPLS